MKKIERRIFIENYNINNINIIDINIINKHNEIYIFNFVFNLNFSTLPVDISFKKGNKPFVLDFLKIKSYDEEFLIFLESEFVDSFDFNFYIDKFLNLKNIVLNNSFNVYNSTYLNNDNILLVKGSFDMDNSFSYKFFKNDTTDTYFYFSIMIENFCVSYEILKDLNFSPMLKNILNNRNLRLKKLLKG